MAIDLLERMYTPPGGTMTSSFWAAAFKAPQLPWYRSVQSTSQEWIFQSFGIALTDIVTSLSVCCDKKLETEAEEKEDDDECIGNGQLGIAVRCCGSSNLFAGNCQYRHRLTGNLLCLESCRLFSLDITKLITVACLHAFEMCQYPRHVVAVTHALKPGQLAQLYCTFQNQWAVAKAGGFKSRRVTPRLVPPGSVLDLGVSATNRRLPLQRHANTAYQYAVTRNSELRVTAWLKSVKYPLG